MPLRPAGCGPAPSRPKSPTAYLLGAVAEVDQRAELVRRLDHLAHALRRRQLHLDDGLVERGLALVGGVQLDLRRVDADALLLHHALQRLFELLDGGFSLGDGLGGQLVGTHDLEFQHSSGGRQGLLRPPSHQQSV